MPRERGIAGSEMRRRSIGTLQLSVGALFAGQFPAFTTTDTGTIFTLGSVDFWVPDEAAHIYVPTSFQIAHSVDRGRFHFWWTLWNVADDGSLSAGVNLWIRQFIAIPGPSEWMHFHETPFGLMTGRTPGRHRVYWLVQNATAGTLFFGLGGVPNAAAGFVLGTVDS